MHTLEEIAKLADVSRSTVSRVINNDSHVSEETRSRVLQIIQDVGFQPNRAASSLAGGRMRVIGLVIPTGVTRLFSDPYFLHLIQGITNTCNIEDYGLMLWLASYISTEGLGLDFRVEGFWNSVLGALIISVVSVVVATFVKDKRSRGR